MSKIAKKLTDLIGNTPLLELGTYRDENKLEANLIAKLEYFNPLGSVKDRVANAMIETAIKEGKINKDTVIIEPTSGNTGIGLAFVTATKGLRLILTMPETMSIERRRIVSALGAEVVLTPGVEGMKGAIAKAEALKEEYGNAFIPQQFENEANPKIHFETTGPEIWKGRYICCRCRYWRNSYWYRKIYKISKSKCKNSCSRTSYISSTFWS